MVGFSRQNILCPQMKTLSEWKEKDSELKILQKYLFIKIIINGYAQILQKKPNNYETDLIFPLIEKAASLANLTYNPI